MNTIMAREALALASSATVANFDERLADLKSSGIDVAALIAWGSHYVPRTITNGRSDGGEGKAYFDVLHNHGLLTREALFSALVHLSHRCKYRFFKELYEAFFPADGDKDSLAVPLAYFNETHTSHDIEDRIAVMSDLGLLNLSDAYSRATEAMLTSILKQSVTLQDISFMKMFVTMGYPADGWGSCGLRMVPFVSGRVDDAEFFLSRGAAVEARGYEVIFYALSKNHLPLARHLFELAAAEGDPSTIKAMVTLYGHQIDEDVDVDLLDAPPESGGGVSAGKVGEPLVLALVV